MKKLLYCFIFLSTIMMFAQTKLKDTITRRANITYNQKGNSVSFKPETPPLIPIAGAPKPSYSYLWELGDGHYSKQAEPKHVYKKKGNYSTRLAVTNNYDNGKPPATRPKKVAVNDITDTDYKDIASIADQNGFEILKNCDPIPEQEMVVVVSYQNLENYVANGKLYLFYNEKQFKNNNFELVDFRTYAGEREVKENTIASIDDLDDTKNYLTSAENTFKFKKYKNTTTEEDLEASLKDAHTLYHNVSILEFDDVNPNETRNVFYTFKTTPEMIKDTSATVPCAVFLCRTVVLKTIKSKISKWKLLPPTIPTKWGLTEVL